jgi:spermidine synthase
MPTRPKSVQRSVLEEHARQRRRIALALFTASGVAGLTYEVVWSRQLTLIFGATTLAVSTVLTTFMFGLGLGSFLARHRTDRAGNPLRLYAVLEAGIGIYAVLFPAVLWLVERLHGEVFHLLYPAPLPLALSRFVLAFLALLPPALLMGATVPVMGQALEAYGRDADTRTGTRTGTGAGQGADAGRLYAWNTLGAAMGSAMGGFLLIPAVGFRAATLTAAGINLAVALVAWRVAVSPRPAPPLPAETLRPPTPLAVRSGWLLACYALSGFAALAYEVVLTRILVLVFGSSVYSFAVVLTGFLLGIGLGSLLAARWVDRATDPAIPIAILQAIIGGGILLTTPLYDRLPEIFFWLFRGTQGEWFRLVSLEFLVTLGLLLVPTTAMGAMFPAAARVAALRAPGLGRAVGTAYSVNTAGSVLGAFAGGFLLIPWLGLQRSLLTLAAVNLGLAALLLWRSQWDGGARRRVVAGALAAAPVLALALLPGWDARLLNSGVYLYAPDYERMSQGRGLREGMQRFRLLYYREGVTATVSVFQGQYLFMRVNGKTDAGDSPDNLTQRLLAHVPLLLHREPRDVLVIGLGSGVTLGAALRHPIARADTVEISPEVVEASRFFERANDRALADPRAHLLLLDGRTWLTAGPRAYDVIISEPSNPWQTGNANLFTREHFLAARRRLKPGGLLCQWLPYYRMPAADFRAAVKTFSEVFPLTTLWISGPDALMVGSLDPVTWDLARLQARFEAERVRTHLSEVGIATPIGFLGHLLLLPEGVQRFVDGERTRHTDDWPLLEFSGPRALFLETARGNLRAMEQAALEAIPVLSPGDPKAEAAIRTSLAREYLVRQLLEPAAREARRAGELDPRSAAAAHVLGVVSLNRNDLAKAETAFREAVRLRPDFAEAYNDLGGALFRLQRPDEAVAAFRRAAELNYSPALYNLGNLYLREKQDPARAREVLERAVRLATASAETWNALGVAYALQGDFSRAKRAWDQALRLDPEHAGARRNRERVEQALSRPGAAGSAPRFLD